MKDLFESFNGDTDIQKKHINDKGEFVITAGLSDNGVLGRSDIKAKIFQKNTITIDMFGFCFYRNFFYKLVTHARVFSLKFKFNCSERAGLFISNSLRYLKNLFGYENMCSWEKIKNFKIFLPTKDGEIDFEFMEKFITELESEHIKEIEEKSIVELEAYLTAAGLKDFILTDEEKFALENLNSCILEKFLLKDLFGESTRGKRLKSDDRIEGNLPFVTAGETDEGISDYIGNEVKIFSKNTITIDMFGSAKYRNYNYGADDHIAVVHTEKISKFASIFVTAAIHKSSHNGQFHYGRNFYAKDADSLEIYLPTKDGEIDYEFMEKFITAVQKIIIADVVKYSEEKISVYRQAANK